MEEKLNPEFIGAQQRLACMLLLDTSSSMNDHNRIESLNEGLRTLLDAIRADDVAPDHVDLAMMTFDSSVKLIHDFLSVDHWQEVPRLKANGLTNMGAALTAAMARIKERKQEYRTHGVAHFQPWLFVLTDGEATDSTDEASAMLREAVRDKKLTVWPIAVGPDVDLEKLSRITNGPAVSLNPAAWKEMFVWIAASMSVVSRSKPREQVELPTMDQWRKLQL